MQVPDFSQHIEGTTAQTSYIDAVNGGLSKLSSDQRRKMQQQTAPSGRRVMTRSPISRYRYIPTENLKF